MTEQIITSSAAIIAIVIVSLIALRGWQGWLTLKELELDRSGTRSRDAEGGSAVGAARIEIADLKERIRKLEAIASGVDL